MEFYHWVLEHGFDLVGVLGIVGSLCFTAYGFLEEAKSRQVGNLIALTASHRDIWKALVEAPELGRILSESVNLRDKPVSKRESVFLTFIFLHLYTLYQTIDLDQVTLGQAVEEDIREFLALPLPGTAWEQARHLYSSEFVDYVERIRRG